MGIVSLRRSAFTLIELLVVVAIILILAGISLRIIPMINNKTATARTMAVLETVKCALGAYYSTYGSYPNVSSVTSTSPDKMPGNPPQDDKSSPGLTKYIMTGTEFGNVSDPMRGFFNSEASRWQYVWKKLVDDGRVYSDVPTNLIYSFQEGYSWKDWTNKNVSIRDGWDRTIRYQYYNSNNIEGYRLWSLGPNGSDENGGGDDILVTFQ